MRPHRTALALVAALCFVTSGSARQQAARPPAAPAVPWVESDFPFFSSVLDAGHAGGGLPAINLTPRALVLNLGDGLWAAFDTDLLRVAAIWRGNGITAKALAPGSYDAPDKKTPGGQSPSPAPDGTVWMANGIYPGWQAGDRLSLDRSARAGAEPRRSRARSDPRSAGPLQRPPLRRRRPSARLRRLRRRRVGVDRRLHCRRSSRHHPQVQGRTRAHDAEARGRRAKPGPERRRRRRGGRCPHAQPTVIAGRNHGGGRRTSRPANRILGHGLRHWPDVPTFASSGGAALASGSDDEDHAVHRSRRLCRGRHRAADRQSLAPQRAARRHPVPEGRHRRRGHARWRRLARPRPERARRPRHAGGGSPRDCTSR